MKGRLHGSDPSGTTGDTRVFLARMRERYRAADRATKSQLLDEVCEVTGYHRKSVTRRFGRAPTGAPRRRGRPVQYGPTVVGALRRLWVAAGYPWSVRLRALLPAWLPWARRHWRLSPAVVARLADDESAPDGPVSAEGQTGRAETAVWAHDPRGRCSSTTFR